MAVVVEPIGDDFRRQRDIAIAIWQQTRHTASTYLDPAQRRDLTDRLLEKLGFLGDVAARF